MNKISRLHQTGKTVFSIYDLRILWPTANPENLKSSIQYHVDTKQLIRLRKGLYALSGDYNRLELAQKLIMPSYISLETALQRHGIVFQANETITSFAPYFRQIKVDGRTYHYHKMNEELLLNPIGLIQENHYTMASPERAVCDSIHLHGETYLDNLRNIDRAKLEKIAFIYPKKITQTLIRKLTERL